MSKQKFNLTIRTGKAVIFSKKITHAQKSVVNWDSLRDLQRMANRLGVKQFTAKTAE